MSLITMGLDPNHSSLVTRGLHTYIIEVIVPPAPEPQPEPSPGIGAQVGGSAGISPLGGTREEKRKILLRFRHEDEELWQETEIESEDKLFDDFWIKFIVMEEEESKKINVYIKEKLEESDHFSFRVGDILEDTK